MTGRTDGESEGSLYRFHDVDAPDFRERTVARGDAQSRLVEPRNPANAEKSRSVIFAAGGRTVFERGDGRRARHEHHSRLVDRGSRILAEIFQRRTSSIGRGSSQSYAGNR